jgi:hypothetical protein
MVHDFSIGRLLGSHQEATIYLPYDSVKFIYSDLKRHLQKKRKTHRQMQNVIDFQSFGKKHLLYSYHLYTGAD